MCPISWNVSPIQCTATVYLFILVAVTLKTYYFLSVVWTKGNLHVHVNSVFHDAIFCFPVLFSSRFSSPVLFCCYSSFCTSLLYFPKSNKFFLLLRNQFHICFVIFWRQLSNCIHMESSFCLNCNDYISLCCCSFLTLCVSNMLQFRYHNT